MARVNAQQKCTIWTLSGGHTLLNRWQFAEHFVSVATASQPGCHSSIQTPIKLQMGEYQIQTNSSINWNRSYSCEQMVFHVVVEMGLYFEWVVCEWQCTRLWQLRYAQAIVSQFPWCNVWYCRMHRSEYIRSTNDISQFSIRSKAIANLVA